jgi:hypothetical protein
MIVAGWQSTGDVAGPGFLIYLAGEKSEANAGISLLAEQGSLLKNISAAGMWLLTDLGRLRRSKMSVAGSPNEDSA